MCHEGQDSENIYIVVKGEFEVSKVIDVNEQDLPGRVREQGEEKQKHSTVRNKVSGTSGERYASRMESTKVEFR